MTGPKQALLRQYLHGSDLTMLYKAWVDWSFASDQLKTISGHLHDYSADVRTKIGGDLGARAEVAFQSAKSYLHERSTLLNDAANKLNAVYTLLTDAQSDQDSWDLAPLTAPTAPNPNDPKYDPTNPENVKADGTPKAGHDYNADSADYNTANTKYTSAVGTRETAAQNHMTKLDTAFDDLSTSMKAIHQQPDPPPPPTGGASGGTGATGGIPGGSTPITVPPRSHVTVGPQTGSGTGTQQPISPIHHHPPGVLTGSGGGGTGGHGGGGWAGPGGSGGEGSTWNGTDSHGSANSGGGLPGGVGLGAAVLGGGLVAGAGGMAGLRALGGMLGSAEEGGLGISGRGTGGPGVLGKGGALGKGGVPIEEEGAGAGGRGAGGMGGRGAGGGAGGRGRGKGKKRPDGEHGDMWDDGQDWIDDEGAAPGVLD